MLTCLVAYHLDNKPIIIILLLLFAKLCQRHIKVADVVVVTWHLAKIVQGTYLGQ